MTNKEMALSHWGLMSDELASVADRLNAWQAFEELCKTMKVGAAKLVGEDPHHVNGLLESLRALRNDDPLQQAPCLTADELKSFLPEADPLEEEAPKPAKVKADSNRGLITAKVKQLLVETTQSYTEIEAVVKTLFPDAKTTTRSIASTASEMRKAGIDVAQRRAPKGEKSA